MGGPHKAEYSRGGRGVSSLVGCFMRDLLAVAGVVVLAVCLGVTAAYLSVDLTPPGLDLIRPPKPAVAEMSVTEPSLPVSFVFTDAATKESRRNDTVFLSEKE